MHAIILKLAICIQGALLPDRQTLRGDNRHEDVYYHPISSHLFKCRRSVGSDLCQKMRIPKLYVILKKIITKGMNYTQTATKLINLFNVYERLKSLSPFTFQFLLDTRFRCFRICAKNLS